jgi:hypothetical protein
MKRFRDYDGLVVDTLPAWVLGLRVGDQSRSRHLELGGDPEE